MSTPGEAEDMSTPGEDSVPENEIQPQPENEGNRQLNNSPRKTMDMLARVTSFAEGCASATRMIRSSSVYSNQSDDDDSTLQRRLLSSNPEGSPQEELPYSTPPDSQQISGNANESQRRCSFTQALVNVVFSNQENQAEDMSTPGEDSVPETEIQPQPENQGNRRLNNSPWPRTFRKTMDMLAGVTIFVEGCASATRMIRSSSVYSNQSEDDDSTLQRRLLSSDPEASPQELPYSTPPDSRQISGNANESQRRCSFTQALVNGICVLSDIGFLTTAYAVKEGGWLSLTLLILLFFIAYCTGIYLMRCLQSTPRLETYPELGQAAFGATGRKAISVILYLGLYATCVEYAIMMRDIMSMIWPNAIDFLGIHLDAQLKFVIVGTLILLPTVLPRHLGFHSCLSVGAAGASVVVILCLLWVGVADQGFHLGGTVFDFSKVPISIGIYSFCFANHSAFPNLYASMEEPERFPRVLKASFIVWGCLCILAAICGFLIFGNGVESQFTLNMTTTFAAGKIAVCTVIVMTISKYALTLTPIASSLEEVVNQRGLGFYGVAFVIRTALVISTLLGAKTFPFFASVMALLGSLFAMLIAVIVPCACYFSILRAQLTDLQIATCLGIAFAGLEIASVGTYSAITTMAGQYALAHKAAA